MRAFHVVIPARYGSTRLPGKPLLDIRGKSLIQRVYECAKRSAASRVVVATDDARIVAAVEGFGGEVCLTSAKHSCGTDRIAELVSRLQLDDDYIVVNLQGDEPLIRGDLINQVVQTLVDTPEAVVATASYPIRQRETLDDPNVVKVVTDRHGLALYFSRASIPYVKNGHVLNPAKRHIGIYAYRAGFVKQFTQREPSELEQAEGLEQLRVLQHGERIAVCVALHEPGAGVDTPADLERVRHQYQQTQHLRDG